jgi:hypothetical protein
MNQLGNAANSREQQITALPARTWASFVNNFSGMVDETRRVIKSGGLQQPGVAEHLQASRISNAHSASSDV